MSITKLGDRNAATDIRRIRTMLLSDLAALGIGGGSTHSPVSLDTTVSGIFDISATQILSAESTLARGDLLVADSNPNLTLLNVGGADTFLKSDGSDPSWQTLTISDVSDLSYATPGLTLGTSNAAGAANSVIRSDATLAIFDATNPVQIDGGDSAATGSAGVAARRDHAHAVNSTSDGAANHSTLLQSNASGQLTLDDLFLPDGGTVGISGNELLTFNAAGNIAVGGADLSLPTGLGITHADASGAGEVLRYDGTRFIPASIQAGDLPDNSANPTASVGLSVVNGSASTWMRSDAAPPLDQSIEPTWTGDHIFETAHNALSDLSNPANYPVLVRNPANDTNEMVALGFYISTDVNDVGAAIGFVRTGAESQGELRFYTKQSTADATDPVLAGKFANDGDLELSYDLDIASGLGIIHADSVTDGQVLRADGTRFVPASIQAGDLPAHASSHESGGSDTVNHDSLVGFVANEHINHTSVTLTAGSGLTGGGDISANRSFAVGAGDGINVAADTIAVDVTDILGNGLGESSNNIYVYELRESDDGAAALTADANGDLTMAGSLTVGDGETIGQTAGPLLAFDDTNNYLEITGANVGIKVTDPAENLQVGDDSAAADSYIAVGSAGNNAAGIKFLRAGNTDASIAADTDENLVITYQESDLSGRDLVIQRGSGGTRTATFDQDGRLDLAHPGTVNGVFSGQQDGIGGFCYYAHEAIDGTSQTIIANGSGDVTATLRFFYTVVDDTISANTGNDVVIATPGNTYTLLDNGSSVLTLDVDANGSVTVYRSSGGDTFDLSAWMVWV